MGLPCDTKMLPMFDVTKTQKQVSVELIFCKNGLVADITPQKQIRALPFVLDVGYNYQKGETIPVAENATARFGHCVIGSEDGNICEYLDEFYKLFRVTDTDGNDLVIRQDNSDTFR